jgi:hypothetical protein
MERVSISGILQLAKEHGQPLEVGMSTGHTLSLRIRAIGRLWFSADLLGPRQSEVVVMHRGIHMIHGVVEVDYQAYGSGFLAPIQLMLGQLELHKARVVLHTETLFVTGRICAVGSDVVGVHRDDGTRVLVPISAVLWLETCG